MTSHECKLTVGFGKYVQLQMSVAHCHRVTLDSVAHWWVPARTPTVHQCFHGGRPWVARGLPDTRSTRRPPTNDNKTQTSLESNVLSQPGADRHLESHMVAEQRDDHMADESKWRRPGSSRRSRRETKPITTEKINQVTKHTKLDETKHINNPHESVR